MDFKELVKPYAFTDGQDRERTPEGQRKWLLGKGIPGQFIDQAFLKVYDKIEQGFEYKDEQGNLSGHLLDHALLAEAQALYKASNEDALVKLGQFHAELVKRHSDMAVSEVIARMNKPLNWLQRAAKKVFRI